MRIVLPAAAISALFMTAPAFATPCSSLSALRLSNTTITAAEIVAAGTFRPPVSPSAPLPADELRAFERLPAFCRVQGVIESPSDSHIEFEVWMPVSGWNGKYLGVGNGGFSGAISYGFGLAPALLGSYATSSTDTGHEASVAAGAASFDGTWALGHPQKIIDNGYRAIHETAEKSKAIIHAFYRRSPSYSYFDSCSNGGRQGLMEAQRFPADYAGVIAGAPHLSTTVFVNLEWIRRATESDPASYIPADKWPAIQTAVLAGCDALDGLKDGLIEDPRKCDFNASVLRCHGSQSPSCLTPPQITALEKVFAGPRDSQGRQIYPGMLPGSVSAGPRGQAGIISGAGRGRSAIDVFDQGFHDLMQNAGWSLLGASPERDARRYDTALGRILTATDPDLTAFQARGGKLILYHGWSDPLLSPRATIEYYESVLTRMGRADAQRFTRLYMVPGMQHCGGGPGPNTFGTEMLTALDRWVENGVAPQAIVATKYRTDGDPASGIIRTRPLCPFPQVARYKGTGSTDVAANFACSAPSP